MIGWLIVLGVVLLLLFALCLPIYVHVFYEEELEIKIKYLFFTFPVVPRPDKPKQGKKRRVKKKKSGAKAVEQKEDKPEAPLWKQIYREKGISGLLHFLTDLGKLAQTTLKKILRHALIKRFELAVTSGGEDAAAAALNYGRACAVVYPAAALLLKICNHRKAQVSVLPDFQSGEFCGRLNLVLRLRGFWLLTTGGGALLRFMGMQIAQEKAFVNSEKSAA